MKKQDNEHHTRYYPPHHFVFYPVVLVLIIVCIRQSRADTANEAVWLMMAAILFITGWLSFMLRQHYALTLQNRLVKTEMRSRYYRLTQQSFELIEPELSFSQIAALRFAPDKELVALINRTLQEQLTPKQIKAAIIHWYPDHIRV